MRSLVTGSTGGIGLALCTLLAERGDEVIAACRTSSPELEALGVQVVEGVDVTRPEAGERIRDALGDEPLDLLIANAGANRSYDCDGIDDLDPALVEHDLLVNAVGSVRTVVSALPNMRDGSKIVLLSSGISAPGPYMPSNFGYKMAKAAVNNFGRSLGQELKDRGIATVVISPGPTNTRMLAEAFEAGRTAFDPNQAPGPVESARRLLATVDAATLESSGSFWSHQGAVYTGPDGVPPAA